MKVGKSEDSENRKQNREAEKADRAYVGIFGCTIIYRAIK